MRGPFDDAIEAQQHPGEGDPPKAGAEEEKRRPPGGKPLLRLLQLLDGAGYADAAETVVRAAVPDDRRAAFDERVAGARAGRRGSSTRSRRRRSSDTGGEAPETLVPEDVAQAYAEAGRLLGGPPGPGPQWQSLGPYTIPNGQTYGTSRVNVSGRVSAIAVDPGSPAHVLCGAANGGVWESFDRGASWAPRTDYASTLAIGAIAFDPSHPATVYCGTGEGNWWAFLGQGILRSTNGGTTWSPLCTAPFVGQGFYDLVVNPVNAHHLVAATTGGVYVSTDGGLTWRRTRTARTWSLAMSHPVHVLPRGRWPELLAGSSDGVWRSTNGGMTWRAVTLPGTPGTFDRLAVALTRADPNVGYAWGANGASAYLWRRSAGAWHAATPPPGVSTGQAWYDWYAEAPPDLATQVYVGAIELYRGDLAGTTWTWLNLSNKGAAGDSIHPDQHALAFEPGNPSTIYAGCDGGLFKSTNRGINWAHCNNGLVISEFEYLAQSLASSRWLIGGTQDNGTERWTGSPVFDHVADGDGGDCGVNRTNPSIVFHTYYDMSPERSTTGGNFGSWTYIPPPVPSGEGSLFYPPFEASATNGDTIAIGGGALYVSRNNGSAWTRLAFPSAATASAMYIPNADRVYVGTTDGRILVTTWNGVTWTALTALTTPRAGANVSDVYVDPNNLNRLWATYSTFGGGRVYRSDDGGSSWIDRTTAALPNLPLNALEVDAWNANRVWVAADLGVYQSLDAGASWGDYSNALPNAFVGDLLFHPHARVLRAGMRNRGIWQIPVDGWLTTPICGVQWTGNLAGNASARWFTFNWPATWHVIWTVMPTNVRPGSPQVTWKTQVERASAEYATYWITVTNLTPDALTFEGRYCILSRY